jgi:hypothetical protein
VYVVVGSGARKSSCYRVAILTQHATRRHIVVCSLSGSAFFFDIISQTAQFSEKVAEHKMPPFVFSRKLI